jgi:carbon-monoxide dehydrogenase medium subunit
MVARSVRGERRIAAADFFQGPMTTALAPDELLAETRLPLLPADTKFGFCEFSRRAGDFAIAMALAAYRMSGDTGGGVMKDARVGIGGVEGAPRRIPEAERALEGKRPGREAFEAAAEAAAKSLAPLDDIRYPPPYRRDVARAMARRALESAAS